MLHGVVDLFAIVMLVIIFLKTIKDFDLIFNIDIFGLRLVSFFLLLVAVVMMLRKNTDKDLFCNTDISETTFDLCLTQLPS